MRNKWKTLVVVSFILLGITGCVITTSGSGSWEIYTGVRTTQHSDEPSRVQIESSVVDKIIDSFTDGEVTPDE